MKTLMQQFPLRAFRSTGWILTGLVYGVGMLFFMSGPSAFAQETRVPWECSEYSPEAQTRCINTLMELQQKKIARLEEQLKAQEGMVNTLKEQMDRQEAFARREAQAAKQDSRYRYAPYAPGYASPYGYWPSPPLGIYLQPPWRYPRYYGFGPGYWGQPGLSFNFGFGGGHRHHRHRHR